ncbi:translation elongation factor Ts [Anaerocolumna aminovalerica]|jgi:elongation factor Ts|uniref:Elongation factor Ts n=1 Tax=Anaerocolumna aminovalerica TaxID=1527 RepID=A0A1I5IFA4_9FIRM|nr:translation elongation factor Ts [Anaerocolumna aminovalerica]MBU5334764.1 translation elongation factor Ts [Anaerocolumna aminovalerica]MDU6265470.1 translation elongation factor Ts [Anaerocolumna aminovalerica]SFO58926.1 translation elongation factor Ts (EF-Ts) [Anaerocolumna aminovalerica]
MAITAAMVKDLREMTGAGMMDCKKALAETDGDMDKAVEFLREKGLAAAEKKAGRIAAEGISYATVNEEGKIAAIVEVNSETDFVAKNEKFREYVAAVAEQVKKTSAADIDAFLAEPWELDPAKTVKEELSSQIAIIGENMNIRRFEKVVAENGFVEAYIHGGGRIGVLIEMDSAVYNDGAREVAKNLAMQVAALNPKYVNESEIPADYIAHEREIIKAQTLNENTGKPENIIEKMIDGRLKKELKEICLLDQLYVKDGNLTVQKYLEEASKELGSKIAVKSFVRFETGEGIEKKEEDFAAEVAKQMGQ